MILLINIHDYWSAISGYFLQIWRYETLSASSRSWQKSANHSDWKVRWHYFLIFCVFFRSSFALINLLWWFFVARALQYFFFIIIKYLSIVSTETRFVWFVFEKRLAKEHHIRNSYKKPFRGPGYRLVYAVKLSLQSYRNTQLRTCIILGIF